MSNKSELAEKRIEFLKNQVSDLVHIIESKKREKAIEQQKRIEKGIINKLTEPDKELDAVMLHIRNGKGFISCESYFDKSFINHGIRMTSRASYIIGYINHLKEKK